MNKEQMQPDYRIFTILSVTTLSLFALVTMVLLFGLMALAFGF